MTQMMETERPPALYLNRREVAEAVGVSPQTLYIWHRDGLMMAPDIQIGVATASRPLYGWSQERTRSLGQWLGRLDESGQLVPDQCHEQPGRPPTEGLPAWWTVPTRKYLSRNDLHLVWGVKRETVSVRVYRGSMPPVSVEVGTTSGHGSVTGYDPEEIRTFTAQSQRLHLVRDPDDLG
jgi:hypothetical protein